MCEATPISHIYTHKEDGGLEPVFMSCFCDPTLSTSLHESSPAFTEPVTSVILYHLLFEPYFYLSPEFSIHHLDPVGVQVCVHVCV